MVQNTSSKKHSLMLDNRSKLSISGVEDVKGFNEEVISMKTSCGTMVVKGEGLHIDKLNLDTGDVSVDGKINSVQYVGSGDSRSGLSKLFR